MTPKLTFRLYRELPGLLLLSAISFSALAQPPLEDISLDYEKEGIVATINLSGPVHYLRHFPAHRGKTLQIYYDRVQDATFTETWQDNEVRRSPPSPLIPGFTVTTRDQATRPRLVIEFEHAAEFSIAAGSDNRSFLITIRPEKRPAAREQLPSLPMIEPERKPATRANLTPEEVAAEVRINKEARALLVQGRDALAAGKNDDAVGLLNKLLLLPPNEYTQIGQEWVGVARQRAGQIDRAKVEYDLYLKLYPKDAGAERVAQRLLELSGKPGTSPQLTVAGAVQSQKTVITTFGSISSTYYHGNSSISTTNTFNGQTTTSSLSQVDQSMLISTVDASERYRSENNDKRLVFSDVDTRNFLSGQPGQNKVYTAYGEIKGRTSNYLMRVGRQSATGAGVLGRFDGVAASYGAPQELRVNGVAGALSESMQGSKPRFFGASMDKGAFSFYGINQTVEGTLDRRAVGSEFRYFDDKRNAYGLLDYDTYFKAVNAAEFTGTARGISLLPNTTLSILLDHIKTPSLSIRNALNGATTSSIGTLLQTMSVDSLRDLALARTAISNIGQFGITHTLHEKWQIGGDFRLTNTTGLGSSGQTLNPAIDPVTQLPIQCSGTTTPQGCIVAQPPRGLERSMTAQLIGSGLHNPGDVWSGSFTFSSSSYVNGNSIFLYNHTPVGSNWLVDTTLQWSSFKDQFGGATKQIMPLLRGSYRFKQQFTVDTSLGYQKLKFSGPISNSDTSRVFYSLGLRWDF
ncbi:hypothetical protein [Sideroxydans lithotrophicus]|uniref:Sporulation domain-containing protein n=1 Tax=Sideroxydans lithotrophicus (strain ES-1) TaxID=580332 RepID=D5CPG4_SIDLE|nr:hypothetical protein [Sideroxydans lithotrophicus]ADE11105.1 sporulation domain-containing protein [Sideroxydans lithotrophicus ES-1]